MAVLGYLSKLITGAGLALGRTFSAKFFHKNVPYLMH